MNTNQYDRLKTFHFAKSIDAFHDPKYSRCLIFGNFGAMNYGDESILAGELAEINRYAPHLRVSIVSRYPVRINLIHGASVRAIPLRATLTLLRAVIQTDIVIIGGGGLFCRVKDGLRGYLYQLYFMLLFLLLPKLIGKKVYALGIGIYYNMHPLLLRLATFFLSTLDLVTVRDHHSRDLLTINHVKATLNKDNSYLMPLPTTPHKCRSVPNIAFALRMPFSITERVIFNKALVQFITQHAKQCRFWFFELDVQPNRLNDSFVSQTIVAKLRPSVRSIVKVVSFPPKVHPSDIFARFSQMDLIVAMRLHSMIFANRLKIPFLGIPYDLKCESFIAATSTSSSFIDGNFLAKLNQVYIQHIKGQNL